MIPLFKVFMADDVEEYLAPVLRSGYVGEGPKVKEFEKAFGNYIGNNNILSTSSGTAALTLALRLAGVKAGDYVITSPMTCLATNVPILSLGAIPTWCDIYKDGTMDVEDVGRMIDNWPDVKAIICMDWGGKPCKLGELKQFGIPVIEDACQSLGSTYRGKHVGSDADYVCFSFQAIKHINTVDGGAIAINTGEKDLYEGRLMRWFGLDREKSESMRCGQDPPVWGYKFQFNDVLASIGLANIKHLGRIVNQAQENARLYDKHITNLNKVTLEEERRSGCWLYTLFVEDADDFILYMKHHDIECGKVHDRNDKKTIFKGYERNLPGVDYFEEHHVCIPCGWWVSEKDVYHIIDVIKGYW